MRGRVFRSVVRLRRSGVRTDWEVVADYDRELARRLLPRIVYGGRNDEESLQVFRRNMAALGSLVRYSTWTESPSGKPHHMHVRVRLSRPVKHPYERILLQAVLGSDRMHEALSWNEVDRGLDDPTVFFEKPEVH